MEPTQFGNYTLLERISHGGMAEVFRAKTFGEAGFERIVAIKLLLPSAADDKEFITMLIDEAKIAGQLTHANIAQIFDLGVVDGRYYIVQEYVSGRDLRSILRELSQSGSRMDISKATHIAIKICEGLHYAHNKNDLAGRPLNLVHRDISPQNVLLSQEGEVKIIDFGIAKAEGRATKTVAGLIKGKLAYMSPEQIRGLPVDSRSDVFATGIILHELLTNKPLFRRKNEFETLKLARNATANPPSHINTEVPAILDAVVMKALACHVDDRYQSASELRDALWKFAHDHNAYTTRNDLAAWSRDPASESRALPSFESPAVQPSSGGLNQQTPTAQGANIEDLRAVTENEAPNRNVTVEDTDVEDMDDEPVEATMVDAFGAPGDEIGEDDDEGFTPVDHDAQWAAAVGGPLNNPSPFSMPSRAETAGQSQEVADDDEEETTNSRDQEAASTSKFPQSMPPLNLDEDTAQSLHVPDRRETVPASEAHAPSSTQPVMEALISNLNPGLTDDVAHAETEPVSKKALGVVPMSDSVPDYQQAPPDAAGDTGRPPMALGAPSPHDYPVVPGAIPTPLPLQAKAPKMLPEGAMPLTSATLRPPPPAPTTPQGPPGGTTTLDSPSTDRDNNSRLYLVAAAVFFLLLAGAASITLSITG